MAAILIGSSSHFSLYRRGKAKVERKRWRRRRCCRTAIGLKESTLGDLSAFFKLFWGNFVNNEKWARQKSV